jgi:plastocyanin
VYIFRKIKRLGLTAALIGVLGMSLAACGDAAPTAAPQPAATNTTTTATVDATPTQGSMSDEVQEVQLTIKEWVIEPANVEVKPGKVRFIVTNTGQGSHNVTVLSGGDVLGATPTFASNESPKMIEVEMKAGTYDMLCSLPGHAAQGQKGTITVK